MNFASTRTIFKTGYKLIILDEADAMTNDAQNALRRSMDLIKLCQYYFFKCDYYEYILLILE